MDTGSLGKFSPTSYPKDNFEAILAQARSTIEAAKSAATKMYGEASDYASDGNYNNGAEGGAEYQHGGQGPFRMQSAVTLDPSELAVIGEVKREFDSINPETHKHTHRILSQELEKLEHRMDPEYLEIDIIKPIKLSRKVLIPQHRHPKFNFVGKLLGPGGQTLKNLAKTHKCHVWILGRGSTRDRAKEEELLNSGDPKHSHFNLPVHVKIETEAPPQIAYARVAGVLQDLHVFLQPVRDEIVQEQMTEMGLPFQQVPGAPRGGRGMPMRGARGGGMRGGRGGRGRGAVPIPPAYPGYGGGYGGYGEYTDFAGGPILGRGRARPSPY